MTFPLRCAAAVALATVAVGSLRTVSSAGDEQPALPAALDSFLAHDAHGTASDRAALLAGQPVVKLLDAADPTTETAVFGGIWVNAPSKLYVEQVKNIEQFERGGAFRVTKRVSDPASVDDFAAFNIPDKDFKDLKNCKIGDCVLKLDEDGINTLRAEVDWAKPTARADANAVFRRLALQYVNAYREGGNARLAVYRNKSRPAFVANEFRSMIDRLPRLASEFPDLKRYLLEYPAATLPNSTDFLYWQEVQFGLDPTLRINHLVIQALSDKTIVASKMLYASHYFWTALEIRVLLPDPGRGPGFWFVMVNRSRSGSMSGFAGHVIRGRVEKEVQKGARAALTATKRKLESLGQ